MKYELDSFKADYDWQAAFQEAVNGCYDYYGKGEEGPISEVVEVIAASEGENDGRDWLCICRLTGDRFCVMRAGCDYTGWDCQASGRIEYYSTIEEAVSKKTLTAEEQDRLREDIEEYGVGTDW